jgi:hypothetical protein
MFEWNIVIQITIGVILSVGAYLYREMKADTVAVRAMAEKTKDELMNYKLASSEKYVTNDHLAQAVTNMNKTLESVAGSILRVEQRLNNQIDNSNARSNQ